MSWKNAKLENPVFGKIVLMYIEIQKGLKTYKKAALGAYYTDKWIIEQSPVNQIFIDGTPYPFKVIGWAEFEVPKF